MNNRSMRLDTECDIVIDVAHPGNDRFSHIIIALRDELIAEHLGVDVAIVAREIKESGSIIATIAKLRGDGRTLNPYVVPDLNGVETWLADNEVLDPEGPDEMFEIAAKRGLFRNLWYRKSP